MPPRFIDRLKNLARGGRPYRVHRQTIFRDACASDEADRHLPPYLAGELFVPEKDSWVPLAFNDRDWKIIQRLSASSGQLLEEIYCNLALDCLQANKEEIREALEFDRKFSSALLSDSADIAADDLRALDTSLGRSLFTFRITAALNRRSSDEMMNLLREQRLSDWVRERFLYAFVYYFINIPSDGQLDFHMSYVMPPGHDNDVEKSVIKFLLRDDADTKLSLAAKIYIGLLCHPYDLLEFLVNHFEHQFAEGRARTAAGDKLASELGKMCPEWRYAPQVHGQDLTPLTSAPRFLEVFEVPDKQRAAVGRCFEFGPLESLAGGTASRVIDAMFSCRWRRYPDVEAYDLLISVARGYRGTALGRLLGSWLTSTYLVPRREVGYEVREALRLSAFIGGVTPFVVASPSARVGLERLRLLQNGLEASFFLFGYRGIPEEANAEDRTWIKSVHWRLSALERDGRIQDWMAAVRQAIPLAPIYLTGIDWAWLDVSLERMRLTAFRGDPSAAYVLLLQVAEERGREINRLRLVLQPVAEKLASVFALADWLSEEFGATSLGFIRFFLSADIILWMDLSENFTSAQAERNEILEILVRRFLFDKNVMSEADFIQEQKAFVATLLMQNVGERQFDISWDVLKRDSTSRQGDLFATYLAMKPGGASESLLPASRLEAPYYFVNGVSHSYHLPTHNWPLASVIFAVIDTFMEHPSQGIESILSVRIRHNNFKREIRLALDGLKSRHISGPSISDRTFIISMLENDVLATVQLWLDRRMHQWRTSKPEALFNFVPTSADLQDILTALAGPAAFDEVADVVTAWLRSKLETQLVLARNSLREELSPAICLAVDDSVARLPPDARMASLSAIVALLKTSLNTRLVQLEEWFACPSPLDMKRVLLTDIAELVADRFEAEIRQKRLLLRPLEPARDGGIERHHVRLLFDLWSEMVGNALKHSGLDTASMRVSTFRSKTASGLIFSSPTQSVGDGEPIWIEGHPFRSLTEALFREGNSGLRKVASLAASIAEAPLKICAAHRGHVFHVVIPLSVDGSIR